MRDRKEIAKELSCKYGVPIVAANNGLYKVQHPFIIYEYYVYLKKNEIERFMRKCSRRGKLK